jgi:hypothetical protein
MATLRRLKAAIGKGEEEIIVSATSNDVPDEKSIVQEDIAPAYVDDYEEEHYKLPPETAEDFVTEVIHARDDPTLNPWTFRTLFLGEYRVLGLVQADIDESKEPVWLLSAPFLQPYITSSLRP